MTVLKVSYPIAGPDAYQFGALDPAIVLAVGKIDQGRTVSLMDGVRVLTFEFSSSQAAQRARGRVLGMHRKGIRTEIS